MDICPISCDTSIHSELNQTDTHFPTFYSDQMINQKNFEISNPTLIWFYFALSFSPSGRELLNRREVLMKAFTNVSMLNAQVLIGPYDLLTECSLFLLNKLQTMHSRAGRTTCGAFRRDIRAIRFASLQVALFINL